MYSKIAISAFRRVSHECRQISSDLMVLKKVSTAALHSSYPFVLKRYLELIIGEPVLQMTR